MFDNKPNEPHQPNRLPGHPTWEEFEQQWLSIAWRDRPLQFVVSSFDETVFLGFERSNHLQRFGTEMSLGDAEDLYACLGANILNLKLRPGNAQ
jgi:hypothetical protein